MCTLGFSYPLLVLAESENSTSGTLVILEPLKLDSHPMQSLLLNAQGCAVRLRIGTGPAQQVTTVGAGESEMLSCINFIEAGMLPLSELSVGLIYMVESGPGSTFNAAVIVSRDPDSGQWYRNETYEGELTINSDVRTIDELVGGLLNRENSSP